MRTRNLIHLQITNHKVISTLFYGQLPLQQCTYSNSIKALRLLLYIPRDKLAWYDEQDRHQTVLKILKPIIHRYLLIDHDKATSKQKKAMESAKTVSQGIQGSQRSV
ncbi:hypothetical protein CLU79DRAFT_139806 [Phycomyces nitens]|nr:hypothetical protein CLU79DRAFT_139806 [Phycomyces nitens]